MTLDLSPSRTDDLVPTEDLIKEAHDLRRRRRRLIAGPLVLLALGIGVFFAVRSGGAGAIGSAAGVTTPSGTAATAALSSEVFTMTSYSPLSPSYGVKGSHCTAPVRDCVSAGLSTVTATTLGKQPLRLISKDLDVWHVTGLPTNKALSAEILSHVEGFFGDPPSSLGNEVILTRGVSTIYAIGPSRPGKPATWVINPGSPPASAFVDPLPSAVLAQVRSLSKGPFVKIGRAIIAGTSTTEYRVRLNNVSRYQRRARSGCQPCFFDQFFSVYAENALPAGSGAAYDQFHRVNRVLDIWLDDQGRLRQVQSSAPGYDETWTFSDFNRTVDTKPPPLDKMAAEAGGGR